MFTGTTRRLLAPVLSSRQFRDMLRLSEALKYHDFNVWNKERGNGLIAEALMSGKPQAIGKLGSTELQALRNYLRYRHVANWQEKVAIYQHTLYSHSGVFPDDPETYARFCDYMLLNVLPQITVIGVWFNHKEATIIKTYAPQAMRVPIASFETYGISDKRWTTHLAKKRVLVVHPFANSIRQQYEKRRAIWNGNDDILPEFELLQIAAPHYPALVPPKQAHWFAALEDMCQQMTAMAFDVALIGAGAYSLPLVAHAKKLGKTGIHLGGATQLYFGIIGGRWDQNCNVQALVNKYWIRPLPEDTPARNELIEGGCYW